MAASLTPHSKREVLRFVIEVSGSCIERDNGNDNRCAVIKLTILITPKYGTSVHRIVITRLWMSQLFGLDMVRYGHCKRKLHQQRPCLDCEGKQPHRQQAESVCRNESSSGRNLARTFRRKDNSATYWQFDSAIQLIFHYCTQALDLGDDG